MSKKTDRPIAVRGERMRIVYAVTVDGSSPAKGFVEGLSEPDLCKLVNLFKWMADQGQIRNVQRFKPVDGPIYEFKSFQRGGANQIRVLCFRDGRDWVLTNGFVKKRDKIDQAEIARARRIMNEDQNRRR